MRTKYENKFELIEPLLPYVEKPSRYINHEWGAVLNPDADYHCCMVYPDTYEVGLPNQGLAILYHNLNQVDHIAAERAYVPWVDMADRMREANVPLLSLEGAAPLSSFDCVAFHVPHEMAATNFLEAMDLAGIPFYGSERTLDDPLIIAGGPSVYNPEPFADLFDLILIGEGEEAICEICQMHRELRDAGVSREEMLRRLSTIQGVYVPSLYEVVQSQDAPHGYTVPKPGENVPAKIYKRVCQNFSESNPLPQSVVPYAELVHDRLNIEVLRGCARGCRFCQAGMTYRPVRERTPDMIVSAVSRGLEKTGYEEVSLTSLSTTDHSECACILSRLNERLADSGIRVSIPSQRLDSFGIDMAEQVAGAKKGGLTFAPEAGSQRLRDVINKNVTEQDLDRAAKAAFEAGWRRVKLYFMLGLPSETDEDIIGIARLADHVYEMAQELVPKGQRGGISVGVACSVFIPKASTPFQWCGQLEQSEVKRRQQLLLHSVKNRAVRVHYHDSDTSFLEAVLSRGGRDITPLIVGAWRRGARFDAWTDQFNFDAWLEAGEAVGLDMQAVAYTPYATDAHLPWEHISCGVSTGFLLREYRKALNAQTTPDCTRSSCAGCGVCPTLHVDNVIVGERN